MTTRSPRRRPGAAADAAVDANAADIDISIRPLEPDDWHLIESLFGAKGACGGCWCMWWRVPRGGRLWEQVKGEPNRRSFKDLVERGEVHGMLALHGDEPVGWCCFGPRRTFPRLETVKALRRDWSDDTWSITCFYMPARWRKHGIASRLLAAATERAFALGAIEVEGYPVVPRSPDSQLPGAFAWTGVPVMFEREDYHASINEGSSRPIMLKSRATPSSAASSRPKTSSAAKPRRKRSTT